MICSEPAGPVWAGARGLLPAAPPGRASNVSAARPARGTAAASNIEQQRHLASTCSNAVLPGKCQQSQQVPALAQRWEVRGRSLQMGARARGPWKGVPPGPLFFCFPNSPNNLLKGFALFSSFTLPCRIKRPCAKDLPGSPPYSGAFLGSEHLSSRKCTLRGSRDLLPAARAQNCSILLPCRWFRTAYSAAARRTLGWDADFSLLPTVCPLVCSPTRPPPLRALSPHLSLPASEVLFSVGHRQNIPIIRFQRKECPPYLNHKTIKPRRLASSALLFCSAPFRIQRRETNSAIKVAFRGCGNVPIRCLPKWNNL